MRRAVALIALLLTAPGAAQDLPLLGSHERGQAKRMLVAIQAAVREHYYDPAYRGIDLDAHFASAAGKLDQARSMAHAYGIIAQALVAFDDSHTFFMPPEDRTIVDYGWTLRMIGDAAYIIAVKPGSDAEAKGLKPGDRVLQVDQYVPTRRDLWKLRYLLNVLSRRHTVRLVIQSPDDASPRVMDVASNVTQRPKVVDLNLDHLESHYYDDSREARMARNRFARAGGVVIWKLSGFDFNPDDVERVMKDGLQGASSLVIDMRGNGGGLVSTLEQIAGRLFDRDVKIGQVRMRKASKPMMAKKRGNPFTGPIAAIVDADSASAAEILARLIQIEKRGAVIGDRSAGAVMQGRRVGGSLPGATGFTLFGASVTNAELLMLDGVSLEKIGVAPDELLLPTGADMAAGRDPVLARAVALVGGSLDAAAAGAMFPPQWK